MRQFPSFRIRNATAVVLGCGAVGTSVALRLAGSGIGRLRLIDRDIVRTGDPDRIGLFTPDDARQGRSRARAAALRLEEAGYSVQYEAVDEHLDYSNIRDLCADAGVLVDCLDNYQAKFLVNDFAVSAGVPWICTDQLDAMVIIPGTTPCLHCLYPEEPGPGWKYRQSSHYGVSNDGLNRIASFLVSRAMKILAESVESGVPDRMNFNEGIDPDANIPGPPDPDCGCCGKNDLPWLEGRIAERVTVLCGASSVQLKPAIRVNRLDLPGIAEHFDGESVLRCNDYLLQVRIEECEVSLFSDGRAIIKGIEDPLEARIIYSRHIGN